MYTALRNALSAVLADPDRFRGQGIADATTRFDQEAVVTRWEQLLAGLVAYLLARGSR